MRAIIDTNVAIHLLDKDPGVAARLATLSEHPMLSVLSRVELQGGVYRDPELASAIRLRLELILSQFQVLPFTSVEAEIYGRIVERCGFSRPRIIDRMIAATAIVREATLITLNPADFRNIPDLVIESWAEASG